MAKKPLQSGAKIMVVDDDPLILELVTGILEARGHALTAVADGEAALFLLPTLDLDLILLDASMPGMDGFEVLRFLKKDDKTADIPVVMLTARLNKESVETALKLGAEDYLAKPINAEKLIARVDRVLGKSRVQRVVNKGMVWKATE